MRRLAEDYYAGLDRGELLIQNCRSCTRDNMYPRVRCPFCASDALGWKVSGGEGILYSFTVQRTGAPAGFIDEVPYGLGVVKLDEGVQVLGRLLPDEQGTWDSYGLDSRVRLCAPGVTKSDRPPSPWFEPT